MGAKIVGPGLPEQFKRLKDTKEEGVGRKGENFERAESGVRGEDDSVRARYPDGRIHPEK